MTVRHPAPVGLPVQSGQSKPRKKSSARRKHSPELQAYRTSIRYRNCG